jgi:F-type H+-transporting ATPase subunit alpha
MMPLRDELATWMASARKRARAIRLAPRVEQLGRVERVGDGIAVVSGLPETRLDELLVFSTGVLGLAIELEPDTMGCVLLGTQTGIAAGQRVFGTGEIARVPVGDEMLGRVVDAVGAPIDGGPPIDAERRDPVERPAPPIVDRDFVTRPLLTGITAIDAMIPIGRGQRELVIGDRKTGKTAIAVDTMICQKTSDVICVYAAVGQRSSTVHDVIAAVRAHGVPERCVFVVGAAESPPGVQWLAPYAACTIAEHFRDHGRDALLIIDDLTRHAIIYRQLSLLLREPPGREAYPGDVFYLHARLLERAAKLAPARGGGSLTALPIAETEEGNLSAYIPTNLVSITDGQIYLDPKLFYEGQKPAVHVGKSVSRVGGKTQAPAMKGLAESLRLRYAQFVELELFTRFGVALDERTRRTIERGRRIRAVLRQPELVPLSLAEEVALLIALDEGLFDPVPVERVEDCRAAIREKLCGTEILGAIESSGELAAEHKTALIGQLRDVIASFAQPEAT